MTKKIVGLSLTALLACTMLAGCSEYSTSPVESGNIVVPETAAADDMPNSIIEFDTVLKDGRVLHCVFISDNRGFTTGVGGPSCDWANAKAPAAR